MLDNHLHLLVRLDPALGQGWSDEEVVRRWGRLFPPRDKARQALPVTEDWVHARLMEAGWVARARQRLQSLSWFMKGPLTRTCIARLTQEALDLPRLQEMREK